MPDSWFADTYCDARAKLLAYCSLRNIPVSHYRADSTNDDGRDLHTDVIAFGDNRARSCLVLISGTHGPEALPGAACQQYMLDRWVDDGVPDGVTVLIVHILNA